MSSTFENVTHMPPEMESDSGHLDTMSEQHQEFFPLYTRVHVWGLLGDPSPEGVMHGIICSPLVPYYHGDCLFNGYLVKLDTPLTMTGPLQSEVGEQGSGRLQVIFVHFSSVEAIGQGEAPTMEAE